MELIFFGLFILTAIISWAWVSGIDNMSRNHPEYKGEDFLNWDDTHTEGEL